MIAEATTKLYDYKAIGRLRAGDSLDTSTICIKINTNLQPFPHRYYDSRIGRFLSEDPAGFSGGDINFYRYVKNNPINLVDPTGEVIWILIGAVIGYFASDQTFEGVLAGAAAGFLAPLIYPYVLKVVPPFQISLFGYKITSEVIAVSLVNAAISAAAGYLARKIKEELEVKDYSYTPKEPSY